MKINEDWLSRVRFQGDSDLDQLATCFVKRTYLEELRQLPRMQDIPAEGMTMRCKAPIFVSHAWLGQNVPDDRTLNAIRAKIPNHGDVGLWIDYCCLPQKRRDGVDDRIEIEKKYFESQIQYIPTLLLKSQVVVFWDEGHLNRAWCVIEVILTDIFTNVMLKQIYHNRERLEDPVNFFTQRYNPEGIEVNPNNPGKLVPRLLVPTSVAAVPRVFYNSVFRQLGLTSLPVTQLLKQVTMAHIDHFFSEQGLKCTNRHDIGVLKTTLLRVCEFAGNYDVSTIKWSGKQTFAGLYPYMLANLSDFTVTLVDYKFD